MAEPGGRIAGVSGTGPHYPALDLLRSCAALLVLCEHARAATFVPFGQVSANRLIWSPFYALTSLGHQAVMVFFALSGFLVGGHVIRRLQSGQWSAMEYTLRRLTRLWIVIVPALGATYLFDHAAIVAGYGEYFTGEYLRFASSIPSLPTETAPANYALTTAIGNFLFLQTTVVPVFGSNGPLWSLAYEFWYYVIFPLLAWAFLGRGPVVLRIAAMGAAMALVLALPWEIIKYGVIWFAGALASCMAARVATWRFAQTRSCLLATTTSIFVSAAAAAHAPEFLGDLALGLIVAMCLSPLAASNRIPGLIDRAGKLGAEISYSLYVFHFPVVLFLAVRLTLPDRLAPSLPALAVFILIVIAALILSTGLWFCFERNTRHLYKMSLAIAIRLGLMGQTRGLPIT